MRRVGMAFVATVLAFVGLELLARLGLWVAILDALPTDEMRAFVVNEDLVFDPVYGWRPAGEASPLPQGHLSEAIREEAAAPKRAALRGYAFGDSQTLGAGLPAQEAWPRQAEAALRARGVDVEVVNLGAGGYRSGQVLLLLERYVLPRRPDFLLVDCMPGDDVRLRRTYPSGSEQVARVLFYSRVYRLLRLGVGWVRDEPLGPVGDVRIEPRAGQMVPGGGNHEEIIALAAAAGVPLWFLDYPFVGQPGEPAAHALAPASRLPAGAQVISSTPRLVASGRTGPQLFLDNNHLSREGSRLVGEAAADVLEAPLRAALPRR